VEKKVLKQFFHHWKKKSAKPLPFLGKIEENDVHANPNHSETYLVSYQTCFVVV